MPPGLGELSASQESFAEFLKINTDLIAVAAEASAPANHGLRHDEVAVWVAKLPLHERDNLLARFIQDDDAHLAAQLRQRIMNEGRVQEQAAVERPRRRTGELLRAAEEHAKAARQRAAKKAATERARRDQKPRLPVQVIWIKLPDRNQGCGLKSTDSFRRNSRRATTWR